MSESHTCPRSVLAKARYDAHRGKQTLENRLCCRCHEMVETAMSMQNQPCRSPHGQKTQVPFIPAEPRCSNMGSRKGETLWSVVASAWEGCHLCSLAVGSGDRHLVENASERSQEFRTKVNRSVIAAGRSGCGGSMLFEMRFGLDGQPTSNSLEVPQHHASFKFEEIEFSMEMTQRQRYDRLDIQPGPTTGSQSCFDIQKSWLYTCLNTHDQCSKYRLPSGGFPTRLICLHGTNTSSTVQVQNMSCVQGDVDYVALSHCWGKKKSSVLTTQNQHDVEQGIELNSLPSTFRDAIRITQQLGYHYLWIDSLCILQDSDTDWNRESTAMAIIYSNAVCTIATLDTEDSDSGIFAARNPLAFRRLHLTIPDGRVAKATTSRTRESPSSPEGAMFYRVGHPTREAFPDSPLLKRAWVLQELVLSPRVIYYGNRQVFWECSKGHASETDQKLLKLTYGSLKSKWLQVLQDQSTPGHSTADSEYWGTDVYNFNTMWGDILDEYTSRALTYDKDRTAAISGLMARIEQAGPLRQVEGLWTQHMLLELLWKAMPPGKRIDNSSPTWSWCSLSSPVYSGCVRNRGMTYEAAIHCVPTRECNHLTIETTLVEVDRVEHHEWRAANIFRTDPRPAQAKHVLRWQGRPLLAEIYPDLVDDPGRRLWLALLRTVEPSQDGVLPGLCLQYELVLVLLPSRKDPTKWNRIGTYTLSHDNRDKIDCDPCR